MTARANVYFVRHGETDANRNKVIQGQLDTPLNEIGLEQAKLVSHALRAVRFDVALSSDLRRASVVSSEFKSMMKVFMASADSGCDLRVPTQPRTTQTEGTTRTCRHCL